MDWISRELEAVFGKHLGKNFPLEVLNPNRIISKCGAAGQIWTVDLAITNGVLYPWATAAFSFKKSKTRQLQRNMPQELLSNQEGLL